MVSKAFLEQKVKIEETEVFKEPSDLNVEATRDISCLEGNLHLHQEVARQCS